MTTWYAQRWGEGKATTVSSVCDENGKHICYFLEDAIRYVKVHGQTAIPAGRYKLGITHNSGLAMRYYNKYPDSWFRGLPTLEWAGDGPMEPKFTNLRVHSGVHKGHTKGCPLTAREVVKVGEDYEARDSMDAMQDFCLKLYAALARGDVFLEITDDKVRV